MPLRRFTRIVAIETTGKHGGISPNFRQVSKSTCFSSLPPYFGSFMDHPKLQSYTSSKTELFSSPLSSINLGQDPTSTSVEYRVNIEYCTGCKWMLRSAWVAQELLTTFKDDLTSVTLTPSRPPSPSGTFLVTLNDSEIIWDRKIEGSFPEAKVLKQRIRDHVNPLKNLGHSDINGKKQKNEITSATTDSCSDCTDNEFKSDSQELDDAEAADLRRHFGVM
eukprot:CAMPEP_0194356584 /NCGR_PEP_ID=MMETSP0174-20130528/4204_1 /TAXON_ID=216777 /ORGANISM="Proboscia alata, Strain PI-D3" /LENGTH=220 /DNA_ID=CAMNT_0039126235 /DNA_START=170 /DNA_END=832 /DNA_ORIENTATION=+